MKNQKLATRYARALLDALPDAGLQDRADGLLGGLAAAMAESGEVRDALLDPAVARERKSAMLAALVDRAALGAGGDFGTRMKNFFEVVLEHGRAAALPTIAEVFHSLKEEAQHIVAATVTTSEPLETDLRQRTEDTLRKVTGRRVNVTYEVQPSLIGGMVTRIGSKVYDGSLRSHLDRMRRDMAE